MQPRIWWPGAPGEDRAVDEASCQEWGEVGPPWWFAGVVVALLAIVVGVGGLLSRVQPSTSASEPKGEVEQVMRYVNEWDPGRDPLVTLLDGTEAKASNVYGVDIGGVRYYYQLTHHWSFDPLRLGAVADYEMVAVVDPGTAWEVLIYALTAD